MSLSSLCDVGGGDIGNGGVVVVGRRSEKEGGEEGGGGGNHVGYVCVHLQCLFVLTLTDVQPSWRLIKTFKKKKHSSLPCFCLSLFITPPLFECYLGSFINLYFTF